MLRRCGGGPSGEQVRKAIVAADAIGDAVMAFFRGFLIVPQWHILSFVFVSCFLE
jgi:hypothetical protein